MWLLVAIFLAVVYIKTQTDIYLIGAGLFAIAWEIHSVAYELRKKK